MLVDLEEAREKYSTLFPEYERLASRIAQHLSDQARKRSIRCAIEFRAKTVSSFVKKAMRDSLVDPLNEIADKAGIRLVAVYESGVQELDRLIPDLFDVHQREDKRTGLSPNRLDYLGIHFLASTTDLSILPDPSLGGLQFEIQVHTRAQHLWATVSHELIYKAPLQPPSPVERALYRLMALVELFDGEVQRGREEVVNQGGYEEAKVLVDLEDTFYGFAVSDWDRKLSQLIVETLAPLYEANQILDFNQVLRPFVGTFRDKLQGIYDDYLDDARHPLISQPESLLIFERLQNDRFMLANKWGNYLPETILEGMAEVWGTPLEA